MSHYSATIWRMEWAEHKIDRTNGSVYKTAARQLTASGKRFQPRTSLASWFEAWIKCLKVSLSLIRDLDEDCFTQALISEEFRKALAVMTEDPRGRKRDRSVSRDKEDASQLSKRERREASTKYCETIYGGDMLFVTPRAASYEMSRKMEVNCLMKGITKDCWCWQLTRYITNELNT